jgi:ATP-dependent exoDNAse (exonuclease V) beta subunit
MPTIRVRTATEWAASGEGMEVPGRIVVDAPASSAQRGLFDDLNQVDPTPAAPRHPRSAEPTRAADEGLHRAREGTQGNGKYERDVITVIDARGPRRPGGARFGELVHAMLATVPLGGDRPAIAALATAQARILAAPAEEIAAAIDTVERLLSHDLIRRAAGSDATGGCRRETPVTLTLPDGTVLEGVVDLAFEEAGEWTIVDYKTDRDVAGSGEARYRRQVALYALAITHATGQPAAGVLIRV